jgi:hypothetical protein
MTDAGKMYTGDTTPDKRNFRDYVKRTLRGGVVDGTNYPKFIN